MEKHFWSLVQKQGNGCMEYGTVSKQVHLTKKVYGPWAHRTARRFAFASHHKRLPGTFVLTTCHNPACVNPAHLKESRWAGGRPGPAKQKVVALPTPTQVEEGVDAWLNDTGPRPAVKPPTVQVPLLKVVSALLVILGMATALSAFLASSLHWMTLITPFAFGAAYLLLMVGGEFGN